MSSRGSQEFWARQGILDALEEVYLAPRCAHVVHTLVCCNCGDMLHPIVVYFCFFVRGNQVQSAHQDLWVNRGRD